ncbi:MAG: HutP family protein [Clostridia bacterium]|nr:HutP family protein [Clostridia bacterium]
MKELESLDIARAAVTMALTATREIEVQQKAAFAQENILTAAVDYGGDFVQSVMKITERAVVCAKREGVINDTHSEEGAIAGAAREALSQVAQKAIGLNVGGKVGVARRGDHVAVAVFFCIGLGHLNEVCIGLGHRAI